MSDTWLKKNDFVPYSPTHAGTNQVHHCKTGVDNDRLFVTRLEDGLTVVAFCHHCGAKGYHNDKAK